MDLARISLLEGDTLGAADYFQQALQIRQEYQSADDPNLLYTQAVIHTVAGDGEQALLTLRAALESGYRVRDIRTRIELASLKDDAELQALLTEFAR